MLAKLILLFVLIPFVEVVLLLEVGRRIGFWSTLGCVVVTGILGASLARSQGLRTLWKLRKELEAGRIPGKTLLEGVLILSAGLVLLTPGFITDIVGFAILYPPVRKYLAQKIISRIQTGPTGFSFFTQTGTQQQDRTSGYREGEVKSTWRVDSDKSDN